MRRLVHTKSLLFMSVDQIGGQHHLIKIIFMGGIANNKE
jgi:hypothetical protein